MPTIILIIFLEKGYDYENSNFNVLYGKSIITKYKETMDELICGSTDEYMKAYISHNSHNFSGRAFN